MNTATQPHDPFQQTIEQAITLYMEYGQFGQGLISEKAEQAISAASERLGAYSLAEMSSLQTIHRAVIDPAKIQEALALAQEFLDLVVVSLPPHHRPSFTNSSLAPASKPLQ